MSDIDTHPAETAVPGVLVLPGRLDADGTFHSEGDLPIMLSSDELEDWGARFRREPALT